MRDIEGMFGIFQESNGKIELGSEGIFLGEIVIKVKYRGYVNLQVERVLQLQ